MAKRYIHVLVDVAIDHSLLSLKAMTDKIGFWLAARITVMWRTLKAIKAIKKKRKADKKKKGKGKKKKKGLSAQSSLASTAGRTSVASKAPPKKSPSKLGSLVATSGSKGALTLSAKIDEA